MSRGTSLPHSRESDTAGVTNMANEDMLCYSKPLKVQLSTTKDTTSQREAPKVLPLLGSIGTRIL